MKKTLAGGNAAETVKILFEHKNLNLIQVFGKEVSVDAYQ